MAMSGVMARRSSSSSLSLLGSRFLRSIASYSSVRCAPKNAAAEAVAPPTAEPEDEEHEVVGKFKKERSVRKGLLKVLFDAKKAGKSTDEALQEYTGTFSMEVVSGAMSALRDADSARSLLSWARKQQGFECTSGLVHGLIGAMRKAGQHQEGHRIVKEELKDMFEPDNLTYSALINAYCQAGDKERVDELLKEMEDRGIKEDPYVFKMVLDMRFSQDGLDGMMEFFKEYSAKKNWTPSPTAYDIVIVRLCRGSKLDEAFEIFNESRSKGSLPGETAHHILIKDFCKANRVDDAYQVAKHMIESGYKSVASPFRLLINMLCNEKKFDAAYEMFQGMIQKMAPSDLHLAEALCKADKLDMAIQVVKQMKEKNVNKAPTYQNLIVRLCKADRLEDARGIFDLMIEANLVPNAAICNALSECFCRTLAEDDDRRKAVLEAEVAAKDAEVAAKDADVEEKEAEAAS